MAKGIIRDAGPDDPIFKGSFVVSSAKRKDAPSKGKSISERFPLVGKSELEKLGFDTSDELVMSLGRTKKPEKSPQN